MPLIGSPISFGVTATGAGPVAVAVPAGAQAALLSFRANHGTIAISSNFAGSWTDLTTAGTATRSYAAPVTNTSAGRTITLNFGGYLTEGAMCVLAFFDTVDASSVAAWIRDSQCEEIYELTVDSQPGDYVYGVEFWYTESAANPPNESGWTSLLAPTPVNNAGARARTKNSVTGTSSTMSAQYAAGGDYNSLALFSIIPTAGGGGSSGDTGLASETDSSLALTGSQARALGLASETDTALALTSNQSLPVGLASETDTALALTGLAAGAVGIATETDTALALTSAQSLGLGLATETDSALALVASQSAATGLSTETDTAFALTGSQALPVGLATETDSALALAPLGGTITAEEVDTAFALTSNQSLPVGLATEQDTALALLGSQLLDILPATETDTAFSLTASTAMMVGAAISVETALALTPFDANAPLRYGYALNRAMVARVPIRYWDGSNWVPMTYTYWDGSRWATPPENASS